MSTIRTSTLTLVTLVTGTMLTSSAKACSPAPSCWIESGPSYLRSVCAGYAKDHMTLAQIAPYLDEPGEIAKFGAACEKLYVHIEKH
jgi:hypothetical protein